MIKSRGFTPLDKRSHLTGFTVIELVVAVLIMLVLASFSMAGYQRYRDRAAMLACEINQKVDLAALTLCAYDNNALPGSLSELNSRYLERAYVLTTEGKRPYTFLAFLKEQLGLFDIAEAAPLPARYYNNDTSLLTCPGDPTPPEEGGVSYALAPGWENRPLSALLDPRNADMPLIIEADERTNGRVVFRHGQGTLTIQTTVKGEQKRKKGKAASEDEYRKKKKAK
jgi:competence protein ComGC